MADSLVFRHGDNLGAPNAVVNRRTYCYEADNPSMLIYDYDGKRITLLRQGKGWKQAELARRAGIRQPSLWALEHQVTKKPKADTLMRIAAALGVPMTEILKKPAKGSVPPEDRILALYASLEDQNKTLLIATAETLLQHQGKKK